jgi:hypothetical protein
LAAAFDQTLHFLKQAKLAFEPPHLTESLRVRPTSVAAGLRRWDGAKDFYSEQGSVLACSYGLSCASWCR